MKTLNTLPLYYTISNGFTTDERACFGRFGYAHFDSLYIKEAGVGYRLGFSATGLTSTLAGGSYAESEAFTVGVGPAYSLRLEENILNSTIVSGSCFRQQV